MGARVRKVTLAITNEEYAWAWRVAKRTKTSISSVLSAAAKEKRERDERDAAQARAWAEFEEYVTDGVPFTREERAAVERELAELQRPPVRRKR
jgi:hypothetical protein